MIEGLASVGARCCRPGVAIRAASTAMACAHEQVTTRLTPLEVKMDGYDVVVVGGGPAGLAAALILGRARKRVLLCDAGIPRNAAAKHIQGFVSRDGIAPADFRKVAREQLAPYDNIEVCEVRARRIDGERGAFALRLDAGHVRARRLLITTGLIDELPALPGYRELWGKAVFQCPYCHGWEVRDQALGYLVPSLEWLEWALFLRGWSRDVVAFTDGAFEVPASAKERLHTGGVHLDERRIRRLVTCADHGACGEHLDAVEFEDGDRRARQVLFVRPPQRQVELVSQAGLILDGQGFVRVSEQMETSLPGVYAAGDLTTLMQGALVAAAAGARAAYSLNHALNVEG